MLASKRLRLSARTHDFSPLTCHFHLKMFKLLGRGYINLPSLAAWLGSVLQTWQPQARLKVPVSACQVKSKHVNFTLNPTWDFSVAWQSVNEVIPEWQQIENRLTFEGTHIMATPHQERPKSPKVTPFETTPFQLIHCCFACLPFSQRSLWAVVNLDVGAFADPFKSRRPKVAFLSGTPGSGDHRHLVSFLHRDPVPQQHWFTRKGYRG